MATVGYLGKFGLAQKADSLLSLTEDTLKPKPEIEIVHTGQTQGGGKHEG